MSDEPSPSPPDTARADTGKIRRALVAAFVVAVIATSGFWIQSSRRTRSKAHGLLEATVNLRECFLRAGRGAPNLRDAVRYAPAEHTPFETCLAPFHESKSAAAAMASSRLKQDADGAREVQSELDALAKFPFDATARGLLVQNVDVEAAADSAGFAAQIACRVAVLEADKATERCRVTPASTPAPTPPAARVVLDVRGTGNFVASSWDVLSTPKRVAFIAAARELEAVSWRVWLVTSNDGMQTFSIDSLDGPPTTGGVLDRPRVGFDVGGDPKPRWLVSMERGKDGVDAGVLARIADDGTLELVGRVPALPPGLELVANGPGAVELTVPGKPSVWAFVLAPRAGEKTSFGGAVLYASGKQPELRPTPGERVLAVIARPEPRVLVIDEPGTLALYRIPAPGAAWSKAETKLQRQAESAAAVADQERLCGAEERYVSLLTKNDATHASLVSLALGDGALHALPFELPADAELGLACGSCPPAALSRATLGVSLVMPVGPAMAPLPVPMPAIFHLADAWRSARAICEGGTYSVAYLTEGKVLEASGKMGSFAFTRPALLAEVDALGAPGVPELAATSGRRHVIWQRKPREGSLLRFELVSNDGSGWK